MRLGIVELGPVRVERDLLKGQQAASMARIAIKEEGALPDADHFSGVCRDADVHDDGLDWLNRGFLSRVRPH